MSFPTHGLLTAKRAIISILPPGVMLYDIRTAVAIPILRFFCPAWDNITIQIEDSNGYASIPTLEDDLVLISYNRDLEGYPVADLVSQAERVSDLTRLAPRPDTTTKNTGGVASSMYAD